MLLLSLLYIKSGKLVMGMEVIATRISQVGFIKINRPDVLNSIHLHAVEQIKQALDKWKEDDDVAFVCLYGEGEKAFCAGGDMKHFYELERSDVHDYAKQFFTNEYELDYTIHTYPKPVVAYMNGIVMGGGVGLSIGATHRIVNEKTKWAMPEMNIGFFPDVGASYFLNQLPGYSGRYLALTASVIGAADALYAGVADYYIDSGDWESLKEAFVNEKWSRASVHEELDRLLKSYHRTKEEPARLKQHQAKIDAHFQYETVEAIVASLEGAKDDKWAEETLRTILTKSPTSLKVTLQQLIKGKEMSLKECLAMEKNLALHFMNSHDFYEGIRAVLVDKDRSPKWKPDRFEDVTASDVERFFTPFHE